MEKEELIAMAVAAIAEEEKIDVRKVRVLFLKEVEKSSLETYIEEHAIRYAKYQLGE